MCVELEGGRSGVRVVVKLSLWKCVVGEREVVRVSCGRGGLREESILGRV